MQYHVGQNEDGFPVVEFTNDGWATHTTTEYVNRANPEAAFQAAEAAVDTLVAGGYLPLERK